MRSSTANYVPYPPPNSNSSTGSLHHLHQLQQQQRGRDAILPAVLEFREDTESAFFNALTINLDPTNVNFKLAPTYTLYMATRYDNIQGCGSGLDPDSVTLWIRIRIGNPDPGARK
jgi:hypothetical protein